MKTIKISPALLKDLQCILADYGYELKSSTIKDNKHTHKFSNKLIELTIDFI